MKDVFLVYDRCCFYEIVILSYFLNYSHCDLVFCSPDGKPVRAMEGFSVHVDASLEDLDKAQIRSFIVPGGAVSGIDTAEVKVLLRDLKQRGALIAEICAVCGRAGSRRNPARCEIDACIRRRLGLRQTGRHCKSECVCRFCIGSCKETGALCKRNGFAGNHPLLEILSTGSIRLEEPTMKDFMNMHPVLADVCDTVLTLLSGSFALLAVGIVWLKEFLTGRSST